MFLPFLVADFAFLTFTAKQPKLTLDVFFGASRIAHLPLPEATPPGRKSKNYTIGNETTRRIIVRTNHPKKRDKTPWKSHGGSKPLLQKKTCPRRLRRLSLTIAPGGMKTLVVYLDFWKSTVCPPETNHWNPKSSLGTGRWNIFLKEGLRGDFKFRSSRSVSVWSICVAAPTGTSLWELKMQEFCHYPVRSLDRRSHLLNNLPSRMYSVYFQNPEIGGEQFQHQWFTNQNITSELCIDRFHCALGMPNAWAQVFAVALSKASHEPTSHGCDTCHK